MERGGSLEKENNMPRHSPNFTTTKSRAAAKKARENSSPILGKTGKDLFGPVKEKKPAGKRAISQGEARLRIGLKKVESKPDPELSGRIKTTFKKGLTQSQRKAAQVKNQARVHAKRKAHKAAHAKASKPFGGRTGDELFRAPKKKK